MNRRAFLNRTGKVFTYSAVVGLFLPCRKASAFPSRHAAAPMPAASGSACTNKFSVQSGNNDNTGSSTVAIMGQQNWTAPASVSICKVGFNLMSYAGTLASWNPKVGVYVMANATDITLGTVQFSSSVVGTSLTLPGMNYWTFATPAAVTSGTKYAIALWNNTTDNVVFYDCATANCVWTGTPRGNMCRWSGVDGTQNTQWTGYSMVFEAYD